MHSFLLKIFTKKLFIFCFNSVRLFFMCVCVFCFFYNSFVIVSFCCPLFMRFPHSIFHLVCCFHVSHYINLDLSRFVIWKVVLKSAYRILFSSQLVNLLYNLFRLLFFACVLLLENSPKVKHIFLYMWLCMLCVCVCVCCI